MTTTTKSPTRGRGRTAVPAPETPAASSPGLDALTAGAPLGSAVALPVASLRPHPSNPRRDLGDLTELTDSIRSHGIRQNLLVVPNPDEPDTYRIVIGHRRCAGAAAAGLATVPAVIDPTCSPTQQLELMLLENLQRTDLTAIEEADAYQGLLDLGLDEKAIARTTGRSRSTVAARLRLRALPVAAQRKVHAHQATLEDAARLLDFADHPDAMADLTKRLGERDFVHYAQQTQDDIDRAEKRDALLADLKAAGVTILEPGEYGSNPKGARPLTELSDKAGYGGPALDPKKHASCPGHVAWVPEQAYRAPVAVLGCKGWSGHGHHDRYGSGGGAAPAGPMTEEQKAERRELVANNKAALAAETVRREWIATYLRLHPTMPPDATSYVAGIVRPGQAGDFREKPVFDSLLYGGKVADRDIATDLAKPNLALRFLVALAAARVEAQMPKDYWRKGDSRRDLFAHHLSFLHSWGYPLADVETEFLAAAKKPGRSS